MKKRRCSCETCIYSVEIIPRFWCQRYPEPHSIPDGEICGEGVFREPGFSTLSLKEIYQQAEKKGQGKKRHENAA
jgi:hypothetical protein